MSDPEDSSSSSSESAPEDRENRWLPRAPSTWKTLTEEERGLAASIDLIRNRDLSLHLYSSFGLKERARKIAKSKNAQGEAQADVVDDDAQEWAPPKIWTAWPLPPDIVPRPGEEIGPDDPDEAYTFKRRTIPRPSRELEEALLGVTLKFAKERFEGRQWACRDKDIVDGEGDHMDEEDIQVEKPHIEADAMVVDDPEEPNVEQFPTTREPSEHPQEDTALLPVVSVDDDRSRQILRPSIRHTLSKLDEVLMALHHARATCHLRSTWSDVSSENEGRPSASRSRSRSAVGTRGRPRKFANLTSRPKEVEQDPVLVAQADVSNRKRKNRLGRPQKAYTALEGETHEEYVVRIARIQKKSLPSWAPPLSGQSSPLPETSPTKSRPKTATQEELIESRQKKLGLRDWSEVLGTAALVGFSPDVIARATQRCSTLFGETMIMKTMAEAPIAATDTELDTFYQPEEIHSVSLQSADEEESDEESMDIRTRRLQSRVKTRTTIYQCPIDDCPRRGKGFNYRIDLKRHLVQRHRKSEADVEAMLDTDDNMVGSVHNDGFLKTIRPLGRGKRKRGSRSAEGRRRSRERSPDEHEASEGSEDNDIESLRDSSSDGDM